MIQTLLMLWTAGSMVALAVMAVRAIRRAQRLERALRDALAAIDAGRDVEHAFVIRRERIEAWEEALR